MPCTIDELMVILERRMFTFGVNMRTRVCLNVLVGPVVALEGVAAASLAIGWRSDMATALLKDIVLGDVCDIDVEDRNIWAASTTVLACISMLLPFPEVPFLFGSEACSCWSTAS